VSESQLITLNGKPRQVAQGSTVADLLAELGLDPRTVAVEHNRIIIKRETYAEAALSAGDNLEVVRFVQGG
jgi:thiamine biosynthesis protein ThiS